MEEKPIRIAGVNHIGAIDHHNGFLWAGLLHGPENGKHDPQLNRSIVAKIRVKDQYHTWQERKSMLFDNSWEHQVYNESQESRIILITDILRPLPFLPNLLNRFTFWLVFCKFFTKDSVTKIQGALARIVD